MATGAVYLRIRRQKAKRVLEEQVEGVELEQRSGGNQIAVVDAETDAWLATLESCSEAAELEVDLSFTPQTRVEYQTNTTGTATRKLQRIKDRLTAAASKWQW